MTRIIRHFTVVLLALCAISFNIDAQVSWSAEVVGAEDGLSQIEVTAAIGDGYHIYDFAEYKNGPSSTAITFDLPAGAELVGEIVPSEEAHKYFDDVFGMEIGT